MSNLTDFFAAGGGGGGGIGKAITVGDYTYANSWDIDTFTSAKFSGINVHAQVGLTKGAWHPNSNHPNAYYAAPTANNTYITVADITGAANGGGLYTVAGSKTGTTSQSGGMTVRLTIDGGTPVEHSFYSATKPHYWHVMGKAFTTSSASSIEARSGGNTQGVSMPGRGNISGYQARTIYDNYDTTTGTYYIDNYYYESMMLHTIDASTAAQAGYPFLHFTTSCKVEIKAATATNTFGAAQILTF